MPFNRVQHVGVIWVLLLDWMVPFSVKLNFCIQNITNNFYKHSKLCIIYLTKLILFTTGAWAAIRHVFPEVEVKGCVFHWSQSVWRHVQGLGLAPAYMEKRDVWEYILVNHGWFVIELESLAYSAVGSNPITEYKKPVLYWKSKL